LEILCFPRCFLLCKEPSPSHLGEDLLESTLLFPWTPDSQFLYSKIRFLDSLS
jgi:hypothetical protein